jgi:hypothetical protein
MSEFKLLEFPKEETVVDNTWIINVLDQLKEQIQSDEKLVTGIGIALTYKDGIISSLWRCTHPVLLVGALEDLKQRVLSDENY